ncbi:MAG: hypothetical protein QOD03_517 [Verrucomicrobiota bacterium]|jgi:hypothetical protein
MADEPATVCPWCGRENLQSLSACAECGTILVNAPPEVNFQPKRKSKELAVCLALLLGPLGLFYANAWGTGFVMILAAAPFVITHTGGLWITFGVRVICAVWAFVLVRDQDEAPNARRDSLRLLDRAARLETLDRNKAIAVYGEIVKRFPNTSASKEAARNIQTLAERPTTVT